MKKRRLSKLKGRLPKIEGKVEGKIHVTKNLVIGEGGVIHAEVKARKVTLNGKLRGDIIAADRVEIGRSASFEGNLTSPRLSIADGAYFKGNVDMTGLDSEGKAPTGK